MPALYNLVVELNRAFDTSSPPDIAISPPGIADGRTLAWIDDVFGGSWSSEARAGSTIIARRNGAPIGFATIEAAGLPFAWLHGRAREASVGLFGPIGVSTDERQRGLGTLLLHRALGALRERGYARALIAAVGDEQLVHYYAEAVGARTAERFEGDSLYRRERRVLVMASGNGSNFQAVIDAARSGELPIEIIGLICNRPGAYVLERARNAQIASVDVVGWSREKESRQAYDRRLFEAVASKTPDLILLLGWMHLLSSSFVGAFSQMLNLHPAFLPLDCESDEVVMPDGTQARAFRGPQAVRDALRAGSTWVGATLHRVTNATDRGPVLTRRPLRVGEREDEAHLMVRVHELERGVVRSGLRRWLYEW